MATSEVAICNMALSLLGDHANVTSIDPAEPGPQAEYCRVFFPTARDMLLEAHSWGFSVRYDNAPAAVASPSPNWQFAYAYPNEAKEILAVLPPNATNPFSQSLVPETGSYVYTNPIPLSGGFVTAQFEILTIPDGSLVICTNQENAVLRYTVQVTDVSKYPATFTLALAHLLASFLAGPILQGKVGIAKAESTMRMYGLYLGLAKEQDSNERKINPTHIPSSLAART